MQIRKLVLVLVLISALLSVSQVLAEDPIGTAEILGIGMGARALGMGGAQIAVADDASVIYYNPAGLARIDGINVTSLYTNQYGKAGYLTLGAAGPNIGGAVLHLGTRPSGYDSDANPSGEFNYSETMFLAGYGRTVVSGLSLGGALKYYRHDLPDNPGVGFTADLGLLYEISENDIVIGVVGRNLLGNVTYQSEHEDPFDRAYGIGVSFKPMANLLVAGDALMENGFTGRIGAEYLFNQVAVRAGGSFGEKPCLTMGLGFSLSDFNIDYSYQHERIQADCHRLSLRFKF